MSDCKPKPVSGRVPIIIGGTGEKRTLKIVAQYADEWCSECVSVEDYARKVAVLERHCEVGLCATRLPSAAPWSLTGDFLPSARKFLRGTGEASAARQQDPAAAAFDDLQPSSRGWAVSSSGVANRSSMNSRSTRGLGLQEAVFRCNNIASDEEPDYLAAEIMPSVRDI